MDDSGPAHRYDSELLRRIADTVSIMLYEMECHADGSFDCLEFIGLETLIGEVPDGVSPEDAYDAAVHPEDRQEYVAASSRVARNEPVDVEYRLVGSDGRTRWVLDRMRPEASSDGRILVGGVVVDITEQKRLEIDLREVQKLAHVALHDPLTGLPNRVASKEHLDGALARAGTDGTGVAVLFVDLDNFKLVVDSFGYAAGDELLRAVAARLRDAIRQEDVVCRQGGDEFLILLSDLPLAGAGAPDPKFLSAAEVAADEVRRLLRRPFLVEGIEIYVSASIGISLYPSDASDADALLKHAEVATHSVKRSGRDGHGFFVDDASTALEQILMAGRLRETIDSGDGLVLHYQPFVDLESGQFVGVEALVRWWDGEHGLIPPGDFIPLAERTGLIGQVSDWVVAEACRQAASWLDRGLNLFVSLNFPPSYCQPTGMNHLLSSARAAGVALDSLVVEVTESALLPEVFNAVKATLIEMQRRGLRLAIDDFGTGYSSLGRLNSSWVSMLKIDHSFVRGLPDDEQAAALVTSVIQLAQGLGLEPIAEGVETERQRLFLAERGCRLGQGFLFSRPVSAEKLELLHAENVTARAKSA